MFGCTIACKTAIFLKQLFKIYRILQLLLVTYGDVNNPADEAKWTIDPPPRLAIWSRATFVPLMTAVVFVLIILSSDLSR